MGWTKKQLIEQAFNEIGLMNYQFDMEPEDAQNACVTLDSLVAGLNLPLSYNMTDNPSDTDLNQDSGLPNWANTPIYLLLAVALCPRYGKVANQDLKARAQQAKSGMYTMTANTNIACPLNNVPSGQGNKAWGWGYENFINQGEQL